MSASRLKSREPAPAWLADETNLNVNGERACPLFEQELRAQFSAAAGSGSPCSLLVLEAEGDCDCFLDVLVGVALLEAGKRSGAFALGRGRFALLLPDHELGAALELARMVELRLTFLSEGTARVWIGAAVAGAGTPSPETLFARADLAMWEAKMRGLSATVAFGRGLPSRAQFDEDALRDLLAHLDESTPRSPASGRRRLVSVVGEEMASRLLAAAAVRGAW